MSDLLTAAAEKLGVPEPLVERAASARADANGTDMDSILQAWAGGEAVASAPAPEAEPAEEGAAEAEPAEEAAPEATTEPATPTPEPAAPEPAEPAAAPAPAAAAAVMVEEPEEPVEAAPLGQRARVAGRVGAVTGGLVGLLLAVVGAPWLVSRATLAGEEGAFSPAVEVFPGWVIVGHLLISVAVGMALAGITRGFTGWLGRGMRLVSGYGASIAIGGAVGGVLGALVGAVVAGSGQPSEAVEGATVVPVFAGIIWALLGWILTGWLVGAVVQVVGVPDGVDPDEAEEVTPVRDRLATAFGVPVAAALGIAVLVLPIAYVFILFPTWAPLLAVFVAASILGFAGLAASRPNLRITSGDVLMAVAGIGVVVVIVVAVLAAQGGGHHEEEGTGAESAEEATVEAVLPV